MTLDLSKPLDPETRERELAVLVDETEYRKRRKASEEKAAEFTSDEWKSLRKLAKTEPFFLAYTVLNYNKLSTDLHGDVCEWIKATEQDRFRLLLLPRGHYKSTIYTITDSIRSALPNDDNSNVWPYCLGTDIRICLMHEVAGIASKFLAEIQNHFLSNEFLMALFPECIPDPREHTINMQQLELPRKTFWKEKTFESMGVGGRSQGNHYNILKPDDLMGKEGKDSKIILQSTKDWIDNLQSFLTSFKNPDHIDFTGTHWGFEDIYFHIQDQYEDQLKVYKRSIEEKGKRISPPDVPEDKAVYEMHTIFPEEFPLERLAILKKNKDIYAAQYMNDPLGGSTDLDTTKLRHYYWKSRDAFVAFDPRTNGQSLVYKNDLDKILLLDPAMKGKLGLVVTGTDRYSRHFTLEAVKDEFTTPNLIKHTFALITKWQCRALVVESVLFSGLYEHIFQEEMRKRGVRFSLIMHSVPLKTDKVRRIVNSLSGVLEDGALYVNEMQKELIQEFKRIGFTDNVHMIDALAMGPHYWRPYNGYGTFDSMNNYNNPVERDSQTGYSAM